MKGDLGRNYVPYTCDLSTRKWYSSGESCTKVCAEAVQGDLGGNSVLTGIAYYEADGLTPYTVDGGYVEEGVTAKVQCEAGYYAMTADRYTYWWMNCDNFKWKNEDNCDLSAFAI